MAPASVSGGRSSKGCWTCKRRKIGCDKAFPSCSNCRRTKRACEGYGVKLTWPDDGDGRRRGADAHWTVLPRQLLALQGQARYFINVSNDDLSGTRRPVVPVPSEIRRVPLSSAPHGRRFIAPSLAFGYENEMRSPETYLLSYYTNVLSRMITTIDDSRNGFRGILLPLALAEKEISSQSLRHAIFAVSASHLWGEAAAVKYKIAAIRFLSQSLNTGEVPNISQFSACMMLLICDVFDSADGSWPMHLRAAKAISKRLSPTRQNVVAKNFLLTWLDYHDVLAGFSADTSADIENENPITLPARNEESSVILGALGCSLEVLNIISCINKIQKLSRNSPGNILPKQYTSYPHQLEDQLNTLIQIPSIQTDPNSGPCGEERIAKTAELYRLAALIYLYQSLLHASRYCNPLQSIVVQALNVMEELKVCTSPWPMFMIACEVSSDEQRVRVLRALDVMQEVRRIGNVDVMRHIIETLWKKRDLNADGVGEEGREIGWRDVFDTAQRMPSFI